MKKLARIAFLISWLLLPVAAVCGQCTAPPTPDETRQRIIDARPNRVFAAKGKTRFGNKGTVVIANMNPFLFEGYRITIQEEEIKDEALVKFAKALIPIAGPFAESARQEAGFAGEPDQDINLEELVSRLLAPPISPNPPPPGAAPGAPPLPPTVLAGCTTTPCLAMKHIIGLKNQLVAYELAIRNYFTDGPGPGPYPATSYMTTTNFSVTKANFVNAGGTIFDRDTDTPLLCTTVNNLLPILTSANAYPSKDQLMLRQRDIEDMVSKAKALKKAVDLYKAQDALKSTKWIGSTGFDYLEDLDLFAQELSGAVNTKYDAKAKGLFAQVVEFDKMKESITNLTGKEKTLLQQEFPIGGKYDFSKITVTVQPIGEKTPENPTGKKETAANRDASVGNDNGSNSKGSLTSAPSEGTDRRLDESSPSGGNRFAEAAAANQTTSSSAPASKTTDVVTTGKPRFELGLGMAYSPVEKRQFQIVSGFARDRLGNLTNGETFTKVVGFSERTENRLMPVAMVHTRLTEYPKHNVYFSLGITGSRDELGTNIEYLIGPSINLSDNLFVTAGAFVARQQSLASDDAFVGAAVPSGFEAIPVRSRYRLKPGLSFSYRLPVSGSGKKKTAAAESAAASFDTSTDTLFAGQPRFAISAGMAYSALRKQSFQPIIGFARNRQGGLTAGETPTKVIGFTEDASGRLLPMALLNMRIRSNQDFGFHFSLGITAKRTDSRTDVEYLVGPSLSFMKNQILFTAGAYAGKQEKIAGDLFINSVLASGTSITTQREYHFKPGFAFSYRLPVKLP